MFQIGDIVQYKNTAASRKKLCYLIVSVHQNNFYDILSLQDGNRYSIDWHHIIHYNKLSK